MKDTKCGEIRYGSKVYDDREGTVVSFARGQVVETEMPDNYRPDALGVLFHPDFIRGTALGKEIDRYSFFNYHSTEALHLSEREKEVIVDCISRISNELEHAIDKHSKRLIASNIELLLDYCMRFYERQFNTLNEGNKDILGLFVTFLGRGAGRR